jgi:hypothetical protein
MIHLGSSEAREWLIYQDYFLFYWEGHVTDGLQGSNGWCQINTLTGRLNGPQEIRPLSKTSMPRKTVTMRAWPVPMTTISSWRAS